MHLGLLVIRNMPKLQPISSTLFLLLCLLASAKPANAQLTLTSPAFAPGAAIADDYACTGADRTPALAWSNVPQSTRSFALIVEDPDAPRGTFIHWVAYNIPPSETSLPAGVPQSAEISGGGSNGINSFAHIGYNGPCPPPGKVHHYHFYLFALDSTLTPGGQPDGAAIRSAMGGHVLATAELVGTFQR